MGTATNAALIPHDREWPLSSSFVQPAPKGKPASLRTFIQRLGIVKIARAMTAKLIQNIKAALVDWNAVK